MEDQLKELLAEQGFTYIEDEEAFLSMWPEPLYGKYRPQPQDTPEQYPCMVREEYIADDPYGADTAVLSIIYLIEE